MDKRVVTLFVLGVVGATLLTAWFGASVYGGFRAQQEIESLIDPSPNTTPLRFSDLQHQKGWLSSSGSVVMYYPDPEAQQRPGPDLLRMQIHYTLDHRITFAHMMQFDWTAALVGEGAKTMTEVFNQNPALAGQGKRGWTGLVQSDFVIPALKADQDGEILDMAAVTGHLAIEQARFAFSLAMPSLTLVNDSGPLRLHNIHLALDAKDRFHGQGRSVFEVAQIDFTNGQAQSFRVIGENSFSGDRLDVSVKKSVARLRLADTTISDLALDLAFSGLDAPSVAAISTVMNVAGNLDRLSALQQQVVLGTIRGLFVQGFSVGISNLSATTENGVASGHALMRVDPVPMTPAPMPFDAARRLNVEAELDLQGPAIAPSLTTLGMLVGILVPRDNGFRASLQLKQGKLTINGNEVPFADEIAQISAVVSELLQRP